MQKRLTCYWFLDGKSHTGTAIAEWVRYTRSMFCPPPPRKSHLGELAIQEVMNSHALAGEQKTGVFLFEDHRIANTSFYVPANCRKISTRAFLTFLEEAGAIDSAIDIERRAVHHGRNFSRSHFPP